MAPCGARGGPGEAQARLPSHTVALHPPPVHPLVTSLGGARDPSQVDDPESSSESVTLSQQVAGGSRITYY